MKARPIIFSSQMIRLLLEDRKNQTRRVVKPQPEVSAEGYLMGEWLKKPLDGLLLPRLQDIAIHCPFGKIGDLLWVKETFLQDGESVIYRADGNFDGNAKLLGGWRSSMFMPKRLSRINLEITNISIERLQDISEEDAIAEGVPGESEAAEIGCTWYEKPRRAYWRIWEQISGKGSWNEDPYVWKIEFRRI